MQGYGYGGKGRYRIIGIRKISKSDDGQILRDPSSRLGGIFIDAVGHHVVHGEYGGGGIGKRQKLFGVVSAALHLQISETHVGAAEGKPVLFQGFFISRNLTVGYHSISRAAYEAYFFVVLVDKILNGPAGTLEIIVGDIGNLIRIVAIDVHHGQVKLLDQGEELCVALIDTDINQAVHTGGGQGEDVLGQDIIVLF